jgi:hypothetical protein
VGGPARQARALLYDLERVARLLSERSDPFDPERDRRRFEHHLLDIAGPAAGASVT